MIILDQPSHTLRKSNWLFQNLIGVNVFVPLPLDYFLEFRVYTNSDNLISKKFFLICYSIHIIFLYLINLFYDFVLENWPKLYIIYSRMVSLKTI